MDRRRLQPIHLGPERRYLTALAGEIERPSRTPPFGPLFESKVVDEPARTRDLRHLLRLLRRWVEPVGVGLADDHSPY